MRSWKLLLPLLASTLCFAAQPDRIAGPIDSSRSVTLARSLHPKALPQYDEGAVEPSLLLNYVTLTISPSPGQQQALEQLLAQQQDRSSPNFQKWLTPEQYAARFGLNQNDLNKVTAWLKSEGFTVLSVARGRSFIVLSGTAAQVQSALGTEIHNYNVNGEKHIANSTPVAMPAALNGIVTGIRGLNDFRPKPMYVRPVRNSVLGVHPSYTASPGGPFYLAPGDIATLYDIDPLFTASTPIDGTGQKLAVVGQTDIYLADLTDFRSGFNLPSFTCATGATGLITSCDTTNFSYVLVGADSGSPSLSDLTEADLDVEWAGAVARNAQIIFINAETTNGVFDALTSAVDNVTAPVISMSYGICEGADNLESVLTQGNAEGITILNSSGDVGSAECDNSPPNANVPFDGAVSGLSVSYPASSPEVTGVGGTSIPSPTYYNSTYWGPSNGTDGGSALSSLVGKEVSWNDDVAFAAFCVSDPSNLFCSQGGSPAVPSWVKLTSTATAQQVQEDIWISSSGGGVSNCFNVDTNGNCVSGFTRPSWQAALMVPGLTTLQKTYRFTPDVALLASPNFPGYIVCTPLEQVGSSGTTSSCSPGGAGGITTAVDTYFSLVGGTSASTPVFAGIVVLLNQYLGSSGLGNINPTLYALAAATTPNGAFHPVITGDNDVYCQPGLPSGQPLDVICPTVGVFGFNAASDDPKTKYNLVTGLGSVDADKLAVAWAASRTASSIALLSSATSVNVGASVTFTATVTPSTSVGSVSFSTLNNGTSTVLGTATLNAPYPPVTSGTATFATTSLPGGSNSVTATYEGDSSLNAMTSAATTVTVIVPYTMSASTLSPVTVPAGQTATSTVTITPASGFTGTVTFTPSTASSPGSCTKGLPAGALCSFSPGSVVLNGSSPSTVTLTITTAANMALPSGAQAITVAGTSGTATGTATVNLTVTKTNQTVTLATTASTFPVPVGGTATVNLTVTGTNGFIVGSGSGATTALQLTYTCTGTPSFSTSEISCLLPNSGQPTNSTAVTVSLVTTPVTAQLRPRSGSRIFYALLLPGLFGIVFAGSRSRRLRLLSLIVVLGFSTLWLGACGGSGSNSSSMKNPGTPAGNYAVTINASTGGTNAVTNSLAITLTVQ